MSIFNRDYEFNAKLKSHEIGNQNIYRLYYMNFHRIGDGYGYNTNNIGVVDCPYKPFMMPEGMKRDDGFKVLSYLTDYIERILNLRPCSWESVQQLDQVLDLERLGFTRLDIKPDDNLYRILDLYTIDGRLLLFKKSNNYKRYFEWYTENVTLEEVEKIYENIGIEFHDLVLNDENKKLTLKK